MWDKIMRVLLHPRCIKIACNIRLSPNYLSLDPIGPIHRQKRKHFVANPTITVNIGHINIACLLFEPVKQIIFNGT